MEKPIKIFVMNEKGWLKKDKGKMNLSSNVFLQNSNMWERQCVYLSKYVSFNLVLLG